MKVIETSRGTRTLTPIGVETSYENGRQTDRIVPFRPRPFAKTPEAYEVRTVESHSLGVVELGASGEWRARRFAGRTNTLSNHLVLCAASAEQASEAF